MAKALVNKGIPIKADNPKDPYIRDENGIKDIVNSSKVFGKTLGTANGKIQLKNGNTVLSEVSVSAPTPDLSDYGKTLAISGQNLSLKNGNTVLSTVTIPSGGGGGGSSAGVSTYTANELIGSNSYQLASEAVVTEIYNKLNNNEDVQIILIDSSGDYAGSTRIFRCAGYFVGEMEDDSYIEEPCYHFTCVIDSTTDALTIWTFDLYLGDATISLQNKVLN